MTKALLFAKLDYTTVKPYFTLKNLAIFTFLSVIWGSQSGFSAVPILLIIIAGLYTGYPFASQEKSGLDALYSMLSINRRTVVLGRYTFTLILDLCGAILGSVISFIALTATKTEYDPVEILTVSLGAIAAYSIVQAIQIPIFFKKGYMKSRFVMFIPFVAIWAGAFLYSTFLKDIFPLERIDALLNWAAENPYITAVLGVFIWFGIMVLSFRISLNLYTKRDL